ncbi:LacI family DNA-binding transcriptional regulator [Planococcus sp. CPCC 101016]|uniref:LacI family DNA-binding transcriptional regulator n=1 Tax=Planococcus sp. CPCC 101016 TaxID=2599617 RepID=UPI0011B3A0D3|nr:LacI family DNA-binding transcriptional regulator [Planococcus sp. CPCC 101016]TWT06506.1 LacI family DNA-binding transcriptional regulator [Planococcus sp. CPCC 101016]
MAGIKDVAKLAGVSVATVSRVLNNHPYVKQEKVEAVKKAIAETGYIQNINAINLKKGKTNLVGVVLPFLDHPYFSQLVQGIFKAASTHRYKLVLYQTGYHEGQEMEALEMLKLKQIDSLVICSRQVSLEVIEGYREYGNIVLFENGGNTPLSYIFVDHYACFTNALTYLYDKGHREIGFCINRTDGTNSKQREQAYRDFLETKGLFYQEEYIIKDCIYLEDGERVLKELSHLTRRPTALIATSDQVAAGIIIASPQYGIAIPHDLAIIGFDNHAIAKALNITTVGVPLHSIGQLLFKQTLLEETSHKEVAVELIQRQTV